jgi:hypothetical protein
MDCTITEECFGIDAAGEEERGDLIDLGAQFGRVLVDRDGVQIDDAEDRLIVILEVDPVLERAEVIADVEVAGRLDAAENTWFHSVKGFTSILRNAS